jgi:hypothetical protein
MEIRTHITIRRGTLSADADALLAALEDRVPRAGPVLTEAIGAGTVTVTLAFDALSMEEAITAALDAVQRTVPRLAPNDVVRVEAEPASADTRVAAA